VRHFIFSSTAAVYGNPARVPVRGEDPTVPTWPYGSPKLMTEIMLRDAGTAHRLPHMILRYFNVAGADPLGRTGESPRGATHLIKVGVKTALGRRPKIEIFGTDYPTPDGTCIRDYIHVSMPLGSDLTSAGRSSTSLPEPSRFVRSAGSARCVLFRRLTAMFIVNSTHRSISPPRGGMFPSTGYMSELKSILQFRSSSSFNRTARLQSLTSRKIKLNERIIKLSV
jgi:NAD dependent epimerase/dehydratase family